MSGYSGTVSEVIFANGFSYPAATAAVSSAQSLIGGASGKYEQPVFPGGFFQQGRYGQVAAVEFSIILAGQASATSVIITAGLNTTANNVSGSTLVSSNGFTCTSFSGGTVHGRALITNAGSGYGISPVSTNLWSTISMIYNNGTTIGGGAAAGGPTELTTVDFSANQWLYLTVTFSTANAGNSATLQNLIVYGLN